MYARIKIDKCALGTKAEEVQNEIIEVNKEKIENWFGIGSYEFVKKQLENKGYYGEAVGQGLRGHIKKVNF